MDYDRTDIAQAYDRGRDHGPDVLDHWMRTLRFYVDGDTITTILDLGCGTGRFSSGLATSFDALVIGVDPSATMLQQAWRKRGNSHILYTRGTAERIPLRNTSVDVIFMSMIHHHLTDRRRAVAECRRVLRETGTVFVRTGTVERIDQYPQTTFFPTSRPLMATQLPTTTSVRTAFEAAGFHQIGFELVKQQVAPNYKVFADKISAGADSVLASLEAEEFARGMAMLRDRAVREPGQSVHEVIDLFVFR